MSQEKVDKMPYNYGQMAGLPAGKGITKLSDIDQFLNLSVGEYITFKTDSIIPMQAYRLKSSTDAGNISYRLGTYRHYDSSWQWPDFHTNKLMGIYFLYNGYYMVKLPDGNYMTAYLDDVYYIKYLIAGSVQLPLGTAERMILTEQEDLKTYITEYSLNSEYLLMMFCQMRYEN